jgi:hypothetical protein
LLQDHAGGRNLNPTPHISPLSLFGDLIQDDGVGDRGALVAGFQDDVCGSYGSQRAALHGNLQGPADNKDFCARKNRLQCFAQ